MNGKVKCKCKWVSGNANSQSEGCSVPQVAEVLYGNLHKRTFILTWTLVKCWFISQSPTFNDYDGDDDNDGVGDNDTMMVMMVMSLCRMMQQEVHACGRGALYSSSLDCFTQTARTEGLGGLYKGFMPVWMRIGPHTIITFFVFEQMRKMLGIKPI